MCLRVGEWREARLWSWHSCPGGISMTFKNLSSGLSLTRAHLNAQLAVVREHQRPEAQAVWADRGEEDTGDL